MSKSYYRSKPAAMVVTVIALSFVLPDSAVAETDTVARAISSARVRRIANQEINKRAPGLSVGSAVSAQSANTANTASSANPVLFARVAADGTVDPANSQGVTSANVTKPSPAGLFCFSGLPAIKGGQVTPEIVAKSSSKPVCWGSATRLATAPPGRSSSSRPSVGPPLACCYSAPVLSSSTCTSSGSVTIPFVLLGEGRASQPVPWLGGDSVARVLWAV